jgi:hypothetical protein
MRYVRPGVGARNLEFRDGKFFTDHGEVPLIVMQSGFQLGCTFVTWAAWNELKRRLEPADAVSNVTVPTPEPPTVSGLDSDVCIHGVHRNACLLC